VHALATYCKRLETVRLAHFVLVPNAVNVELATTESASLAVLSLNHGSQIDAAGVMPVVRAACALSYLFLAGLMGVREVAGKTSAVGARITLHSERDRSRGFTIGPQ